MAVTRSDVCCAIFGSPQKLSESVLPTSSDVMKQYLFIREQIKSCQKHQPTFRDISDIITLDIENLWKKASIPIVSHRRVAEMLTLLHSRYRSTLKLNKSRAAYTIQKHDLLKECESLFDIACCKCVDIYDCQCVKSKKVPNIEIPFLMDQRTVRNMVMMGIDPVETTRLQKRESRKEQEAQPHRHSEDTQTRVNCPLTDVCNDNVDGDNGDGDNDDDDSEDSDFSMPVFADTPAKRQKLQMRIKLPSLASACDRHGVSDRSAAAIASAVLQDIGLIDENNTDSVIDRSKVRRERTRKRKSLQMDLNCNDVQGLYFDGRKDQTLTNPKGPDGKYHRKTINEEHVSIITEPGSEYFSHVSPEGGSSKKLTKSITGSLENRRVNTTNIVAIGCDGTAVNTGISGGVIRLLELHFNHPMQWFICLLHANELPLRHLFQTLDGSTTGPSGYSGPVGKSLTHVEQLPVANYEQIYGEFPIVDRKDLSNDQKYLLDICHVVAQRTCPDDMALRKPGPVNHSRWLTTANRIMRLYIGTEKPCETLKTLATFIVVVYAPMWFRIKTKPSCKDGAVHVYETIRKSRYLSPNLKKIIDPVIQRNAYFAHPENVLLAMITDDRKYIRELGLRRILKARKNASTTVSRNRVRQFKVPMLNMDAEDYTSVIDWSEIPVTEPPVTMTISDAQLHSFIQQPETPIVQFPRFPCHTQAVERCIKLVTEASASVCGATNRDGFIRARLQSRKHMPKLESKCDYKI